MSTSERRTIVLKSSDGEILEVEEAVARQSQTIKNAIEGDCNTDGGIPLGNVTGKILAMVIEYCKRHADPGNNSGREEEEDLRSFDSEFFNSGREEEDPKSFDSEFVKAVDQITLFDLIKAANFLQIKGLLDLTTQAVADMIKGKSPEEISKFFNIENANSPEEEQIHRENAWAFE